MCRATAMLRIVSVRLSVTLSVTDWGGGTVSGRRSTGLDLAGVRPGAQLKSGLTKTMINNARQHKSRGHLSLVRNKIRTVWWEAWALSAAPLKSGPVQKFLFAVCASQFDGASSKTINSKNDDQLNFAHKLN